MIKAEEIINEKKSKNLTDLEIEYFKANKNTFHILILSFTSVFKSLLEISSVLFK